MGGSNLEIAAQVQEGSPRCQESSSQTQLPEESPVSQEQAYLLVFCTPVVKVLQNTFSCYQAFQMGNSEGDHRAAYTLLFLPHSHSKEPIGANCQQYALDGNM